MSTITTLNSGDSGPVSRGVINTNLANLNTGKIETSVLDTDGTLAANSDAKVATQKAVKTYVDGFIDDVSCHIYQTAATGFTSSYTKMSFGAERFDTDTMHDNSTNPERITFTSPGKYLVGVNVCTPANNIGCKVSIKLDNTTDLLFSGAANGSGTDNGISATILRDFTAGQYIEFYVATDGDGGTQNTSGDTETHAWAVRMSL